MKKRLLSCVLAAGLALSLTPAALAVPPEAEMAQVLGALDIMGGYPDGDLRLNQSVTRAEFSKMAVAASPMGENVGSTTTVSPYPDVPSTHWAAPYVEAAVAAGLVNGMLDGTFHPNEDITLAQGVTIAVRLLGYRDLDFPGTWPSGQMALCHSLDLDNGISTPDSAPMTRRDAMCLFYNLLTADTKDGHPYLAVLGKPMTPTGEIDRAALINDAMDGPVVMAPGWETRAGLSLSGITTVYRDGKPSGTAALQPNDVLYYSKTLRTVWAYTSKVSGQLQAVSPSAVSPASVTVAGRTYPIETADAAYALSNLGSYSTGDNVTLLLGRGGGVAAVAAPSQLTHVVYGVISNVTDGSFVDQNGNSYVSQVIEVSAVDGGRYTYPMEADHHRKKGQLVQVTTSGSGTRVESLHQSHISGKVNADGTRIGTTPLAAQIDILDVNDNGFSVKIPSHRLAGMTLEENDVKFVHKNLSGEIDSMILDDFTGDLYTYAVLTSVQESPANSPVLYGTYEFNVGGQTIVYHMQNGTLNKTRGPVKIEGSPAQPEHVWQMDSVKLTALDAFTATTADNQTLRIAPNAAVYEHPDSVYNLSSLDRVRTGYTLTGYCDKPVRDGGCVRIIVAQPIG